MQPALYPGAVTLHLGAQLHPVRGCSLIPGRSLPPRRRVPRADTAPRGGLAGVSRGRTPAPGSPAAKQGSRRRHSRRGAPPAGGAYINAAPVRPPLGPPGPPAAHLSRRPRSSQPARRAGSGLQPRGSTGQGCGALAESWRGPERNPLPPPPPEPPEPPSPQPPPSTRAAPPPAPRGRARREGAEPRRRTCAHAAPTFAVGGAEKPGAGGPHFDGMGLRTGVGGRGSPSGSRGRPGVGGARCLGLEKGRSRVPAPEVASLPLVGDQKQIQISKVKVVVGSVGCVIVKAF